MQEPAQECREGSGRVGRLCRGDQGGQHPGDYGSGSDDDPGALYRWQIGDGGKDGYGGGDQEDDQEIGSYLWMSLPQGSGDPVCYLISNQPEGLDLLLRRP